MYILIRAVLIILAGVGAFLIVYFENVSRYGVISTTIFDPVDEFRNFVDGAIREIDIVRTDNKNVAMYSFTARLDEVTGYLDNGKDSFYINGIDACCLSDDVMDILWKYQLAGCESKTATNKAVMNNCLKFSIVKTDGSSLEIVMQNDIDKRLDACAREIVKLFDTYEYMRETPKDPSIDVTGRWKCEELGLTIHFKGNNSYYCMDWPKVSAKGHYITSGTKVVATDLVDKWDDKNHNFRNRKIADFSYLRWHDNSLYAFFDDMDQIDNAAIFKRL